MLGCVPVLTDLPRSDTEISAPLRRFMEREGFAAVPASIAITPRTGLSNVDPQSARSVMDACNRVGAVVRDEHPEVAHG
jgi:DNA-binding transcriptional regulator PaaX